MEASRSSTLKLMKNSFDMEDGKKLWVLFSRNVGPETLALELIEKAYLDLPFFGKVDRVIIHTKGFDLHNLAELIESLAKRELVFRNIRVRPTTAIM